MESGAIWSDRGVWGAGKFETAPSVQLHLLDLRERAGSKNATLVGLMALAKASGALPVEALLEAIRSDPLGRQIPEELLAAEEEWEG